MANVKFSQFPQGNVDTVKLVGYENDNVQIPAGAFATKADTMELEAEIDNKADISYVENVDSGLDTRITNIEEVIPTTASTENKLVDRDTMNSTITSMAANYVTYNAVGDAFPTYGVLVGATEYYHAGIIYVPSAKDYVTVLSDSAAPAPYTNATTRRTFDGAIWAYSYGINEQPMTADQMAAINSGITSAIVDKIDTLQPLLTSANAGDNVTIDTTNPLIPIINSTGGGGGGGDYIDKMTFIRTIRGTVGRNAHLVPSQDTAYIILSDGIIRSPASSYDTSSGFITSFGIQYPISELRGVRYYESGTVSPNALVGVQYEHFSVSIALGANKTVGINFLCDSNLEYLHIWSVSDTNVRSLNGNERAFSNLPNLNTIIIQASYVLTSLTNAFNDVQNTSDCLLYINTEAEGIAIKNKFPSLSNWTIKTLDRFR